MTVLFIYLLIINVAAFLLMGSDKGRAIKKERRIPESVLLLTAVIGGSLGAFLGMQSFRHKTKHLKFAIGLPVILLVHLFIGWLLVF